MRTNPPLKFCFGSFPSIVLALLAVVFYALPYGELSSVECKEFIVILIAFGVIHVDVSSAITCILLSLLFFIIISSVSDLVFLFLNSSTSAYFL